MSTMLSTIDPEAIQLLEEADWPWSCFDAAFIKAREPEKETIEQYRSRPPELISYEELRDHGLVKRPSTTERDLEMGLQWLRQRLA